ncbi:MAG: hypothetical protein QGF59_13310, partial [Pirellulaceae bacterium]|nr:hypothetical protein [Pirellulaceae bacterium]
GISHEQAQECDITRVFRRPADAGQRRPVPIVQNGVSGELDRMSKVAPTTITGSVAAQKTLQSLPARIIKALKTPTSKSVAKKKVW